ncbi:MAG: pyridoxamine 5'-phosphate oxidase family protein [Patescibacteria group bacterium]
MKIPDISQIKPQLLAFLHDHQIMAISTFYKEPWIASVYYAVDDKLDFYFVSTPGRTHSKQILQQPQVACAIYDSEQTPLKQEQFTKTGVQFSGEAHLLKDPVEVKYGLDIWEKVLKISDSTYFSVEKILGGQIAENVWKVTPEKLKFFNEEFFDENEVPLFLLK